MGYNWRAFRRHWKAPAIKMLLAALSGFVALKFFCTLLGQQADLFVQRYFYALRGTIAAPKDVALVAVDDETFTQLHAPTSMPLPRQYTARALSEITKAGAKVIIIDGRFEELPTDTPEAAAELEAALAGGPTTIWSGAERDNPTDEKSLKVMPSGERFRKAAKMELSMSVGGLGGRERCFISASSKPSDTLFERVPLARPLVELAHAQISSIPGPFDYINFYGPHQTIEHISMHEFLGDHAEEARQKVHDKFVVYGYQTRNLQRGLGNSDQFPVPVSTDWMFGAEINAMIVGNLLEGSWIRRLDPVKEAMITVAAVILLVAYALFFTNAKSLFLMSGAACAATGAAYIAFSQYRFWIGGIGTFLLAAVVTLVIAGFHFILARDRFNRLAQKKLGFQIDDE